MSSSQPPSHLLTRRALLLGTAPFLVGLQAVPVRTVPTLAALRAARRDDLADGAVVEVTASGVGGRFRWNAGEISPHDGVLVVALVSPGRGRWLRDTSGGLDVRWFGAAPNASAAVNSAAFAAASAAINRASGGTLLVPAGTYRVGGQERARGRTGRFVPLDVIRIENCRKPVAILGRGATLKAPDGLRFGAFNPESGARHPTRLPFTDLEYRADAGVMVQVTGCSGPVRIEGLTLDGNAAAYALGGEWGDTGRQVGGDGIICMANTGGLTISDVRCRDHGRDGLMIGHPGLTPRSPRYPVTLTDVTSERNGRQGLSWIGGTALTATRCRFNRTGRGRVVSAPAAGLDIEAEESVCRNGRFVDCEFVDNSGVGMVADTGDSADVLFERCRFVGTTAWSAWPKKPGFVFRDCLFVGSIVQVFGDADPRRATQFIDCRFLGDPKLSPNGKVFGDYLGDLGAGDANVLMRRCDLRAVAPGIGLLWSTGAIRFDNCTFRQAGPRQSFPRGVFTGTNRIDSAGPVGLEGSRFVGRVILNGRALA